MSFTINIYYTGAQGQARAFVEEMLSSGLVGRIRQEEGNERYEYFLPIDQPDTVLLIDQWKDQAALDAHHASPMMEEVARLREKYKLKMRVEKYVRENI
ncbi:MAG: antibiotic biosynthesis monooxygenase [Lachnospiraceae bacterium]|nr:antibiotic biosynthesis monooxygenase [Lachnospiraceae bacterium]